MLRKASPSGLLGIAKRRSFKNGNGKLEHLLQELVKLGIDHHACGICDLRKNIWATVTEKKECKWSKVCLSSGPYPDLGEEPTRPLHKVLIMYLIDICWKKIPTINRVSRCYLKGDRKWLDHIGQIIAIGDEILYETRSRMCLKTEADFLWPC